MNQTKTVDCPTCRGVGWFYANDEHKPPHHSCPSCNGTGQVTAKDGEAEADNYRTPGEEVCLIRHGDDSCECGFDKAAIMRKRSAFRVSVKAKLIGNNLDIRQVPFGDLTSEWLTGELDRLNNPASAQILITYEQARAIFSMHTADGLFMFGSFNGVRLTVDVTREWGQS